MGKELFKDKYLTVLVRGGFKKVCYREWGTPDIKNVLICVHGLSRNRLDFDTIAGALSSHYRILAVDMPGRGNSDWLDQPEDYRYLISKDNRFPIFHNVLNPTVNIDYEGTSQYTHVFLSHEFFEPPCPVTLRNGMVRIRKHNNVQGLFGNELF